MKFTECIFLQNLDGTQSMVLDRIETNRKRVSQEELDSFSQTIPSILAYPPDLTIPKYKDVLENIEVAPIENTLQ